LITDRFRAHNKMKSSIEIGEINVLVVDGRILKAKCAI